MEDNSSPTILITGATGYVGGRLRRQLEASSVPLRCLARNPEYLLRRVASRTQVAQGDLLDRESLGPALQGIRSAYYLVHSMGASGGFVEADRKAAQNFAAAARAAGVERIIYLGGLGAQSGLSPHLASRQEVGRILRESGIPTIEFQASIIIGSGSLSFEVIRALANRLPVMVTPRWTRTLAQPIGIEDVISYLVEALEVVPCRSVVYEIGGPERVSYMGLLKIYARLRGLRRLILPVPVLTTRLSGLWLGLVTPVYARVAQKLIDSVRNETIVTDDRARQDFQIQPRGVKQAMQRALVNEDLEFAQTRWSDALSASGSVTGWGGVPLGSRIVDSRKVLVAVKAERAFRPIRRIGGNRGWYYADTLWRLRGFLDMMLGGVGMRRGRRDPENPGPGDTIDFWRVEAFEPDRLLRLRAEMRLPGRAWLQFEVQTLDDGSLVRQTALFDPAGLLGLAYWYLLYPAHQYIFEGMLQAIAKRAADE